MISGAGIIFFYLFSFVLLFSALMVVCARNPVHSVLNLILVFFNASGLFLLLGAEFLAMILLVVYVGAVAILFLFVVMMFDVDILYKKQKSIKYTPFATLMICILAVELIFVFSAYDQIPSFSLKGVSPMPEVALRNNTQALGDILYTNYIYFFEVSGLILLTAMVGSILLSLEHKKAVKRQNIAQQVARTPESSIEVRKIETGKGI